MPKIVDAEDRRASLAAAAARLIASQGIDGVRLKDIAAEAGWTTGVLTHYFPDKRSVLLLAMTTSLDQLQGHKEEFIEGRGDELRWLLEQALPLDAERLQHWRVSQAFMVQSWSDEEFAELRVRAFRRWRRRMVTLFEAEQSKGRFDASLDSEHAVDGLIALVDGVALQAMYDPERWSPARQSGFLDNHLDRLAP